MTLSRNAEKKPNKTTKVLRGTIKQKTKLKSNLNSEKINKKNVKQIVHEKLRPTEVMGDSRREKLEKNLKPVKKNLVVKTEEKAKKQVLVKSEMKKAKKSEPASTDNSSVEKRGNAQKANETVKGKETNKGTEQTREKKNLQPALKRKRTSAKENAENVQDGLKKKQIRSPSKTVNKQTTKVQKRRKVETNEDEDANSVKDLSKEHILQCISAIFHLTQEQLKSKNALFEGESQPVYMQVTCIRVPKTPRRQMRILLSHSTVSQDDDVALFVCDLQRGRRKDYEVTVDHYQELLNEHNCTSVKTIIPMNQVKTEYDQYELKRKLVSSHDHFLVDGRIAGHMSHLLGKEFYRRRKLPTSVRMQSKILKHEIEHALRKTCMQLHSSGDTYIVQIGHTSMTEEEILENILVACEYLSKKFPGGWANIRSLRIKTAVSLGLPIYMTLKHKNNVMVPSIEPKRPKAYRVITGEVSTVSGKNKVTVTPEGDVIVEKRTPQNDGSEEEESEEEEDV